MPSIFTTGLNGIGVYNDMPKTVKYFQDINIVETLRLPAQKPDIEVVSSMLISPKVISTKLINTPIALSYEGQNLSGYKLLVDLQIQEKVKYVAALPHQPVHSAHYTNINKNVFVVVPEEIDDIRICDLIRKNKYSVTPYVNDVYTLIKDCRTIYNCVSILVDVKFF